MKNEFTISSAYKWGKSEKGENNSEKAIKYISNIIKDRFSANKKNIHNYNINYRRLRASAGRTMLGSIKNRIETSQVVIIDISTNNKNVYIEAGIALAFENRNNFLSVYFIKEKEENKQLPKGIPSDLQGYFISEYEVDNKGKVTFKDDNSLRMSIESDVKNYFNAREQFFNPIDEIND